MLLNLGNMKKNKQILWALVAFLLALLSVGAVLSQSRELTISDLVSTLKGYEPFWVILAIVCGIGYIAMEACALWYLLRSCGFPRSYFQTLEYASADIYCAAITPSATGGQPVCAWFMKRDGIPMGYITAVLAMYLIMHTFATLTIGFICLFASPGAFLDTSILSKFLIILGYLTVTALGILFLFLLRGQDRIFRVGCRIIDWLVKKRLVKRPDYWKKKLKGTLDDYSAGINMMHGKYRVLLLTFLFNLLQRASQTVVSTLMYLAGGGAVRQAGRIFATQIFTSIGSMCLPVPGGMGVSDYLLYDGLRALMDKEAALKLELLSRTTSFYLCVAVSLLIVIIGYIRRKTFYFSLRLKK